nr:sugar ABC transporter substrate-binding protein [Neobacillus sp. Marseille-Q6967]
MKRKTKKLWAGLIFILTLLFIAGCTADTSQPTNSESTNNSKENTPTEENTASIGSGKEELEIAWVHMNSAAQSEQRAKKGFEDYLKDKGYKWNLNVVDSKGSGQNLASNIEDAIQRKVDAIIISMADLRAAKASIEEAKKAGIPIFSVDSGWTDGILVDVTSNNFVMSSKVSSYLVDRLGGEGKIVAFKMAEHHGVRKRGEVLDVIVKENPGIEVLEEHNIDYTNFYEDTLKTMEDYIARYGDEIDAVWAGWDEPAMAAASAIQAAGMDKDKIFVVGIDGHPPAIEEMKNGSPIVASVAQGFETMGEKIGGYIYSILTEGKPVNEVINSTTVYVDTPLITDKNPPKDGVAPYKAEDFYSSN